MSESNKTRYEVQKILSDVMRKGIETYVSRGIDFTVLEYAQATFQKGDRLITIQPIRTKRAGWNMVSYRGLENFNRVDDVIEEQHWQVQIILKKSKNPTIDELQADDVANTLVAWINGLGSDEFRKRGCAPLRIDSDNILVYNDDSDLYQKRAVFTVKLQVPKEYSTPQAEMSVVKPNIMPV